MKIKQAIVFAVCVVALVTAGCQSANSNKPATNTATADLPHVLIETQAGNIEVELDAKHAPITAKNFLGYVDAGLYDRGAFFRTVTLSNQPTNNIKIQVIQAEADTARRREYLAAIPLERTRDTGLRHTDGSLSMARYGPDTARDSFSIVIGDQPEMDFGGKRNADGQGFAVFGHVVKGMDVVHKIQSSPAQEQQLRPRIGIVHVSRVK